MLRKKNFISACNWLRETLCFINTLCSRSNFLAKGKTPWNSKKNPQIFPRLQKKRAKHIFHSKLLVNKQLPAFETWISLILLVFYAQCHSKAVHYSTTYFSVRRLQMENDVHFGLLLEKQQQRQRQQINTIALQPCFHCWWWWWKCFGRKTTMKESNAYKYNEVVYQKTKKKKNHLGGCWLHKPNSDYVDCMLNSFLVPMCSLLWKNNKTVFDSRLLLLHFFAAASQ